MFSAFSTDSRARTEALALQTKMMTFSDIYIVLLIFANEPPKAYAVCVRTALSYLTVSSSISTRRDEERLIMQTHATTDSCFYNLSQPFT